MREFHGVKITGSYSHPDGEKARPIRKELERRTFYLALRRQDEEEGRSTSTCRTHPRGNTTLRMIHPDFFVYYARLVTEG